MLHRNDFLILRSCRYRHLCMLFPIMKLAKLGVLLKMVFMASNTPAYLIGVTRYLSTLCKERFPGEPSFDLLPPTGFLKLRYERRQLPSHCTPGLWSGIIVSDL